MRIDEIVFESQIQNYSDYLKDTLRKSRKTAIDQHTAWLRANSTGSVELHPLETLLNVKVNWSDDTE